ncbi:MAG: hypothetical protein LBV04_08880 [Deferribacteraceae bacterium]|jgi:hypothetical protein|nr:hypothetical protein [Deferribacteraceae bacterium]
MNHEAVAKELAKIRTDATAILPLIDKPEWSQIETAGVAATIAAIYSGFEHIFVQLCANKVRKNDHWHMELLKSAVEERIVPLEMQSVLKEMLAFRHIQRNYYGHELREPEVRKKANEIMTIIEPFEKHISEWLKI